MTENKLLILGEQYEGLPDIDSVRHSFMSEAIDVLSEDSSERRGVLILPTENQMFTGKVVVKHINSTEYQNLKENGVKEW